MRLGVLDVGSNTVHYQIMDVHIGAAPTPYESFKNEIRLAEYLDKTGAISETGIRKLVWAINNTFDKSASIKVDEVLAFATSAIREASNSIEVLHRVGRETDLDLEVLSGAEEAKFTFLAARRWLGWHVGDLLVLDIGGGSLEIAYGEQESPSYSNSVMLGAGRLTRAFLEGDPFSEKSIFQLKDHINGTLLPIINDLKDYKKSSAVTTSKTFRSLGRLQKHFMPNFGENLTIEGIDVLSNKLQKMSIKERSGLPGISQSRAPQIVAGAMVAHSLMKKLKLDYVIQCPWALREGIVLHRIDWISK